jgi:hypothetical protein
MCDALRANRPSHKLSVTVPRLSNNRGTTFWIRRTIGRAYARAHHPVHSHRHPILDGTHTRTTRSTYHNDVPYIEGTYLRPYRAIRPNMRCSAQTTIKC